MVLYGCGRCIFLKAVDIVSKIHDIAPFDTAMSWDNCGLLVGNPQAEVTGIVLCMDATHEVVAECVQKNCSLIVSHHPIIFSGLKTVQSDTAVYECIRHNISVISAHTNIDLSTAGTNAALARAIGLVDTAMLEPPAIGLVGYLPKPATADEFAEHLRRVFGIVPRRNPLQPDSIHCVGICSGAGADEAGTAYKNYGIQAFVTADVKHFSYILAQRSGFVLYDCGHFQTEAVWLYELQKYLSGDVPVYVSEVYHGNILG